MPDQEVGHILSRLFMDGAQKSHPPPNQPPNSHQYPTAGSPIPPPQPQPQLPPTPAASSSTPTTDRKRTRPTKSCGECRRKKLRCDRELPCSQCLKGGRDGSGCFYAELPESGRRKGKEKDVDGNEGMERRVKRFRVEEPGNVNWAPAQDQMRPHAPLPVGHPGVNWSSPYSAPAPTVNGHPTLSLGVAQQTPNQDHVRGAAKTSVLGKTQVKGSMSQYLGAGDGMAILEQFEDARDFIIDSFKDPQLVGMMKELSAFQTAFHPKSKSRMYHVPHDRGSLISEMLNSLPPHAWYWMLQERYLESWETIHRVVNKSWFVKASDKIYRQQGESRTPELPLDTREPILPQMLSVVAIAIPFENASSQQTSTSKQDVDDQIRQYCTLVQRWLDGLKPKDRLNIHTLQTQAMLLLARQPLASKFDLWQESGSLVRKAMIMGLHQDPEHNEDIPNPDKEERRKLWRTIVELDMQFSLAAGMPAALRSSDFISSGLINIDDQEITDEMIQSPKSQTWTWTDALPQIALGASLKNRLDVTNLLGGHLNIQQHAGQILEHAKTLEMELQSLPRPLRLSSTQGRNSTKKEHELFASIMLDVTLQRPLLSLYRVLALSPQGWKYPDVQAGAIRASLAILSHLDAIDPAVADLNIIKSGSLLQLFHTLYKDDIMQAALMLCFEIRRLNHPSRPSVGGEYGQPGNANPYTPHGLTRTVENTLSSLLQRLGEFRSDLKSILPLSVVLQSVRSSGTSDEKRQLMIKGAERVLNACRKVLPGIQDATFQDSAAQSSNLVCSQSTVHF